MQIMSTFRKRANKPLAVFLYMTLILSLLITGCSNKESQTENQAESLPLKVNNVDELEGKVIGVQLGTTGDVYVTDYEGDDAGTVVDRFNKGNDAVHALKQDKVDAVVIDEEPAKAFVAANPELVILEEEFANEDYAICVSKDNPQLTADINDALAKLGADGTLDMIKKNYTGTDEEKGQYPYIKKDVPRPNGTLVVATNGAFKPYEYYENGVMTGLDVDMMQAVCDELGMELKMEDMEFESIISAVQS